MKKIDRMSVFMPDSCKAIIFVVHGMQEHRLRYDRLGDYLASQGICTLAYDLPGHGVSLPEEERGYFGDDGWRALVDSAVFTAEWARRKHGGIPLFFFGHSMGTMIGRCFLQENASLVDGMILSGAPCYQPAAFAGKAIAALVKKTKGKRSHSKLLDQLATGSFNKGIKSPRSPLDWLSYNEENVDAYIADEACGFPFTAQGYEDLFDGMIEMNDLKRFKDPDKHFPIYLFAGEDDPCIGGAKGWHATQDTLRQAGYENISARLYPGMRHETLNEKGCEAVMQDICDWIDKQVA